MRSLFAAATSAVLFGALTVPLAAQWPPHPVGVPQGPDGKPNLAAPAPRTVDGKPDFSGIWMIYNGPDPGDRADRPPRLSGGLSLPMQPWAADLQRRRAAEGGLNDPDGLCLPQGPLQYHIDPQPLKIVQTPTQILIIYESNYGLRTIYMDGRSLPPLGQAQPFWHGYSVGRWDGDTLVVESNNLHGVDEADRAVPAGELRASRYRVHRGRPEGLHEAIYRPDCAADRA